MNARAIAPASFRPCAVVPTYDNPLTVRAVVEQLREHLADVVVVDDGSGPEGRAACEALDEDGLAVVVHRERNGGKGAAVKTGLRRAAELGFSHALQVDADGQHDLTRVPEFLRTAAEQPEALVIGYPEYDESAPSGRKVARRITNFWVNLEAGRGTIRDAMVGFRVYPLERALAAGARGDWMDFDIEIAVKMAWDREPVVNLPVPVRYPDADEGGVSHFKPLMDNLRFGWLHSRLMTLKCTRFFLRLLRLTR